MLQFFSPVQTPILQDSTCSPLHSHTLSPKDPSVMCTYIPFPMSSHVLTFTNHCVLEEYPALKTTFSNFTMEDMSNQGWVLHMDAHPLAGFRSTGSTSPFSLCWVCMPKIERITYDYKIPWHDLKCYNSLTFTKIPWIFPDLEKIFSTTGGNPVVTAIEK